MNENTRAPADWDALLDHLVAKLTCAVYHVALRHAAPGTWLDLELDLWQALADTVKQWESKSFHFPGTEVALRSDALIDIGLQTRSRIISPRDQDATRQAVLGDNRRSVGGEP